MPTWFPRADGAPTVGFDPLVEVSPFTVFRRLRDGNDVLLVDVRSERSELDLTGAQRWPGEDWEPPADRDVVLFDDDDTRALELAKALRARGHERVRALYGGLDLWAFALDPEVVGAETFLVRIGGRGMDG